MDNSEIPFDENKELEKIKEKNRKGIEDSKKTTVVLAIRIPLR